MTVRMLENEDLPALLELLTLQDEEAIYRAMSPESRTLDELRGELGDESPYTEIFPFVLERSNRVVAYLSLCNLDGEAFVEGPLLAPELSAETLEPLTTRVVETARAFEYPFVEAFVDEENARAREGLEAGGFEAFRTTYIYSLARGAAPPVGFSPFRFEWAEGLGVDLTVSTYRDLYRDTSDNWATRLAWSDEDLIERFEDPDVRLLLAYKEDALVGHLELEFFGEDGFAEVAYFGVLPHARGQGLGRALLTRAAHEVFDFDDMTLLLARAHDDERQACHSLETLGFTLSHGVVALTLELTGEG